MDYAMSLIRSFLITSTTLVFAIFAGAQPAPSELPSLVLPPEENLGRFADALQWIDKNDPEQVIQLIEREIARGPVRQKETGIYDLLALSAMDAKQPDKAYAAVIHSIAQEPASELAWQLLQKLRPEKTTWAEADLPTELKEFRDLLPIFRCGHYKKWAPFVIQRCAKAYETYAKRLVSVGRSATATRIRNIAFGALVEHAAVVYFEKQGVDEADDLIALATTITDPSQAPPEVQSAVYSLLSGIDRRKRRYLHAIGNYEQLARITGGVLLAPRRRLLERLLHEVFEYVSWDPETGLLRTQDPTDFFDIATPHGEPLPTGPDGQRLPYGMTSADEDDATLVTALFVDDSRRAGKEFATTIESVDETIKKRLESQNFELPVKILLGEVGLYADEFGEPPSAETVLKINGRIDAIEASMASAAEIPDPTLVAFEVAKRAWLIVVPR